MFIYLDTCMSVVCVFKSFSYGFYYFVIIIVRYIGCIIGKKLYGFVSYVFVICVI